VSAAANEKRVLQGAKVFDGEDFALADAVTIAGARIERLGGRSPRRAEVQTLDGGYLVPGFVDLQVNGGGGVMLNSEPSVEALTTMIDAHRRSGTTALLPTVISDTQSVQRSAVEAVERVRASGESAVLGVHLEGPYLDAGKRGVHRDEYFRRLTDAEVSWLTALAGRMAVLVTLAPEHVDPVRIRRLATAGVVVCGGHTDASFAEVVTAAAHGLAGFTHLYNAMRGFGSREPGVVGAALDLDDCACGIIVDGHHVSAAAVRLASRAKPAGKLFLVSDAMATAGTSATRFELYGEPVTVEDGCLRNREGRLAGSAITLADAVRIAHQDVGLPLSECLRMASLYPARFMGADGDRGRIASGYRADLVHLGEDLAVRGVWVGGRYVQ
jgi:N-acetylglucosamine-6-phosphate deacetylase